MLKINPTLVFLTKNSKSSEFFMALGNEQKILISYIKIQPMASVGMSELKFSAAFFFF